MENLSELFASIRVLQSNADVINKLLSMDIDRDEMKKVEEEIQDIDRKMTSNEDFQLEFNANVLSELREIRTAQLKINQRQDALECSLKNHINSTRKQFEELDNQTRKEENIIDNNNNIMSVSEVGESYLTKRTSTSLQRRLIKNTIPVIDIPDIVLPIQSEIIGTWKSFGRNFNTCLDFSNDQRSSKLYWKYSHNGIIRESRWEHVGHKLISKDMIVECFVENNHLKARFENTKLNSFKTYDRYIQDGKLHVEIEFSENKQNLHLVYQKAL